LPRNQVPAKFLGCPPQHSRARGGRSAFEQSSTLVPPPDRIKLQTPILLRCRCNFCGPCKGQTLALDPRDLGSSPHCSTNQSPHGGDFPERPQIPTYWRHPARSTWSLDSRTLPRRTLWPFCLCTLKSLFPGNGDRLDLRLVRGWDAARLRHAQGKIYASPSRTARPRFIRGAGAAATMSINQGLGPPNHRNISLDWRPIARSSSYMAIVFRPREQ
jgi:hypothetical protein